MKNTFLFFAVLFFGNMGFSQNSVNFYNFSSLPQSLIQNPAYNIDKRVHVGIPVLSNVHLDVGSSGVVLYDLFADNSIPVEEKFRSALGQMKANDAFMLNQKTTVLDAGYRLNREDYLSFGYYQELDFYSNFPKSMAELFYEGTSFINKRYTIEGYAMQAELLGVYHVGLQRKVDKDVSIGGRVKLYSGVFNVSSKKNKGYMYTDINEDNQYVHGLSIVDVGARTSGVISVEEESIDDSNIGQRFFLGNLGLGLDLGMTYSLKNDFVLSASITDIGFVYNSRNVSNYHVLGSFRTDGIALDFDEEHPTEYWEELESEFSDAVDISHNSNHYISWRPTQMVVDLKHVFAEKRLAECNYYGKPSSSMSSSAIGGLVRAQKRPETVLFGASIYYEKNFNNIFETRVSYTVDKFSYTNVGLSASLQLWKVNLFAGVNNIIGLADLSKANSASVQLGLNVLIE